MQTTETTEDSCSCGAPAGEDGSCTPCRRALARWQVETPTLTTSGTQTKNVVRPMRRRLVEHDRIDEALAELDKDDIVSLGRQLHQMLEVVDSHDSTPDGFPSQAIGSSDRAKPASFDADADVKLTSTEATAVARQHHRDEIDTHTEAALGYVRDAMFAIRACRARLDKLTTLRNPKDLEGDRGCWALGRVGGWEQVKATVEVDGEMRPLGRWAYDYYRATGMVPTKAECKAHRDGKRVYRQAS